MEKIFWERIDTLIKEKKLKYMDAAKICNVTPRTFTNWKYKNLYPSIIDGYKLVEFLGVSVEYLVTGKENKMRKKLDEGIAGLEKAIKKIREIAV